MIDFRTRLKQVKYFSRWRAREVLEQCKQICDKQKKEQIEEFLEDLKDFELKRFSDMMRTLKRLRDKWEAKLKGNSPSGGNL